jgi:hypothetical protein
MKRWLIAGLLILAGLLIQGTALAHEEIVSGDYALVVGWLEEPPLAGLKNAVTIEVSRVDGGAPVDGAEATLTAQIQYGGQARDLILRPIEDKPGAYAGDFIPTRRGTYTLVLGGSIEGQPVEASAEIEEVTSAGSLEFPEAQPTAGELQASIDEVRGEVSGARAFGVAGLALAAIGLVLAAVALGRRK